MASITWRDWPSPLFGKDLDVERRRFAVHVVREDPGEHLVLGADDVVGAGVVDADDLLVLRVERRTR